MPSSETLFPFYRATRELGVSRAVFRELLAKFRVRPVIEHRRRQYFSAKQLNEIREALK